MPSIKRGADSALTLRDMPLRRRGSEQPRSLPRMTAATAPILMHIRRSTWSSGHGADRWLCNIRRHRSASPAGQPRTVVPGCAVCLHDRPSGWLRVCRSNLHQREQIRSFCKDKKGFSSISRTSNRTTPTGRASVDKFADDNCDYDSDGNGSRDRNWAQEWQNTHPGQWYSCGAAHSQPLNANRKAYAAWCLWARLAGWGG
jgi:hypothetical protein